MFNKLHAFYKDSILLKEKPDSFYFSKYHFFKDTENHLWIGILFKSVQEKELSLLKTLYRYEFPPYHCHANVQPWYDFLFFNGEEVHSKLEGQLCQFTQFQLKRNDWETNDVEEAILGFFESDSFILWEDHENGLIIELEPKRKLNGENIFLSLIQLLESDLYISAHFYVGKQHKITKTLPQILQDEKYFFQKALELIPYEKLFTFEKAFPFILTAQLPEKIHSWLNSHILRKVSDDPELIKTVKAFLENNSNSTLTAKQLYIHRNTLQYRLDRFTEKTGINLKVFQNILPIYLTCLLYEQEER